jgi:hypothetical protein
VRDECKQAVEVAFMTRSRSEYATVLDGLDGTKERRLCRFQVNPKLVVFLDLRTKRRYIQVFQDR